MSAAYYVLQLQTARRNYDRSGDRDAYMADCLYVALAIGANGLAQRDPRLKYLSTTLSGASYAIKGLVDKVAHDLVCPIENGHDHEDFLMSWYHHGRKFVDRDTQVVRDILNHMGLWRHS